MAAVRRNRKNRSFLPVLKKILVSLLFIAVLCFVIVRINSFLKNARYFKVKKVRLVGLENKKLVKEISNDLLYDNIFCVDIKKVKDNLKITNPQFYGLEVVRRLPDELIVQVAQRRPFAQIYQKDFFLVDREGVIVSDASSKAFSEFMVIKGLEGLSSIYFGTKISSKELASGLRAIEALEGKKAELIDLLPGFKQNESVTVDVTKYPSLFVYVGNLELRLYDDSLLAGLRSLKEILNSLDKKIDRVKYIDLRFTDPAVSFKS